MRHSRKSLRSKLSLASETVRILGSPQLSAIRGGDVVTQSWCPGLPYSTDPDDPYRPFPVTLVSRNGGTG